MGDASEHPAEFIAQHGYQVVDMPEPGDIIAYGGFHGKNHELPFVNHFGTYLGSGQVGSKFGNLDVYRHSWYLVPASAGNIVFFFRKQADSQPQTGSIRAIARRLPFLRFSSLTKKSNSL